MVETERFNTAVEQGEITEQTGYHQPDSGSIHGFGCSCRKTTSKGAYRDVTVAMDDGRTIHFYHQSPVVVETADGRLRLSSCGYRTSTTKERINSHLPSGYYVRQDDFTWYLERPDGPRVEFEDGMVVEP